MTQLSRLRQQRPSSQKDPAVSALIGVILIIFLVLALSGIMSAVLFGLVSGPVQKSAYIVVDAKYSIHDGFPMVTLTHIQGDAGHLGGSGAGYPLAIQVSSGGIVETATPDPIGLVWSPGVALFIVRTGSGYVVTRDQARIAGTSLEFPGSDIHVSVIDTTNNVLVFEKNFGVSGNNLNITSPPTSAPTTSPTSTPTSVSTTVPTLTPPPPTLPPTPTTTPISRGPGLSVTGWIRFTSPPAPINNEYRWATMVVDGNRDATRLYHMQHNYDNTKFEFDFRTAKMAQSGKPASLLWSTSGPVQNKWYYLAGIYNQTDGRVSLYVNGIRESSQIFDTSGPGPSTGIVQTGGPAGIQYYGSATSSTLYIRGRLQGDVRGISLLDQAIGEAEVLSIYNMGSPK